MTRFKFSGPGSKGVPVAVAYPSEMMDCQRCKGTGATQCTDGTWTWCVQCEGTGEAKDGAE